MFTLTDITVLLKHNNGVKPTPIYERNNVLFVKVGSYYQELRSQGRVHYNDKHMWSDFDNYTPTPSDEYPYPLLLVAPKPKPKRKSAGMTKAKPKKKARAKK